MSLRTVVVALRHAKGDGAPIGALVAEAAVAARATIPSSSVHPTTLDALTSLVADHGMWSDEIDSATRHCPTPSSAFFNGRDDPGDGPLDHRLVLVHERRWIDLNVERAPALCGALRTVPGLVSAAVVVTTDDAGDVAPEALPIGTGRCTIDLDTGTTWWDFDDHDAPARSGRLLELAVDTNIGRRHRALDVIAAALRPYRPRAYWVGHRIDAWSRRAAAEEEPPEGVIVDTYDQFGAGSRSIIGSLTTAAGRRDLVDRATIPIIMGIVHVNNLLIERHEGGLPAVLDAQQFAWTERLEAAWPEIRAEVDALLSSGLWVPSVREVAGVESEADRPAVGTGNRWRNFILYHRGQWMDWNCAMCPRTTELVRTIPELNFAFFSILEPGGHIVRHRGPNRGALRYHLGVKIPEPVDSCRIEINGCDHTWSDGETLVFDLTSEHEVWNTSDEPRVLLMCEMNSSLPRGLRAINRATQAAYSLMPPFRRMKAHLRSLETSEPGRSAAG